MSISTGNMTTTYSGSATFVVTLNSGTTTFTTNYRSANSGINATFSATRIIVQVY
jgi:hypothetical protein